VRRVPICHGSIEIGQRGCFADADEKPHDHERSHDADQVGQWKRGRDGREGRKDRPPDDGEGQHAAWSPSIPQPSTGYLKERIPQHKGRKDLSHLQIGEAKCRHHLAGGDGNIHPVDIGDDADEEEQKQYSPADVRRCGGGRQRVHGEELKR
jgi:hypothetical protein